MTRVNGKTNAEKCIEANAKARKNKPVYKHARQVKSESKKPFDSSSIDFSML